MKIKSLVLAMVFGLLSLVVVAPVHADSIPITIDFNSLGVIGLPGFTSYTESGVTFTTTSGGALVAQPTPVGGFGDGSIGIIGNTVNNLIPTTRADIAGGATFVSVDLGDFGADSDLLFLEIYNASNILLDSTTLLFNSFGLARLSLSNPDIAFAIFGATSPALTGSSVLADNFTFTPLAVPEPSTLLLLGSGLLVGAAFRKRLQ